MPSACSCFSSDSPPSARRQHHVCSPRCAAAAFSMVALGSLGDIGSTLLIPRRPFALPRCWLGSRVAVSFDFKICPDSTSPAACYNIFAFVALVSMPLSPSSNPLGGNDAKPVLAKEVSREDFHFKFPENSPPAGRTRRAHTLPGQLGSRPRNLRFRITPKDDCRASPRLLLQAETAVRLTYSLPATGILP